MRRDYGDAVKDYTIGFGIFLFCLFLFCLGYKCGWEDGKRAPREVVVIHKAECAILDSNTIYWSKEPILP